MKAKATLYLILLTFYMISGSHLISQAQGIYSEEVIPYTISIPDSEIQDLKSRLISTRWTDAVAQAGWDYGTDASYLHALIAYWANEYDWRAQEKYLNQFHHYQAHIYGHSIHFIHEKGKGKTTTPIVLLHGWPSSFVQMLDLIPLLTKADEKGHSFDVIVPSLPGYGFSDRPKRKGFNVYQMAETLHTLMTEKLGYASFMLRASDIGAGVVKEWALSHPSEVMRLHLSGSNPYTFQVPENLSEAEEAFLLKAEQFMMAEGAYAMQHSTKPQTLAYGLNDSPAGLAAWIIEKFRTWSDSEGNIESRFPKDALLTNISIYWFTQTIGSSMRAYYESAHTFSPHTGKKVQVPTAFMMLAKDIAVAPREWEARIFHVVRWNEHASGGHFAEWEEPQIIADDIIAFRKSLNP